MDVIKADTMFAAAVHLEVEGNRPDGKTEMLTNNQLMDFGTNPAYGVLKTWTAFAPNDYCNYHTNVSLVCVSD